MNHEATELILHIEELAANAVPPAVTVLLDGWRLRYHHHVTRRGNSVWPNRSLDQLSLAEKIARVERFYGRRGGKARYQICPAVQPANLDAMLADRGYIQTSPTFVQTASVPQVLERGRGQAASASTIRAEADAEWEETYCQIEEIPSGRMDLHCRIWRGIGLQTAFATLHSDGKPAAVGLGVLEAGWVGIFNIATHPDVRRQGGATAVLHDLAAWGQRHQAEKMYLQVRRENEPALVLYRRLGFTTLYTYHYREAAVPAPVLA